MYCVDLSERVIATERNLIARADTALKGGRPGERAAECPARIRETLAARGLEGAEVDWCSVPPQKGRLLNQLAVIPCGARLEGEPGCGAHHAGGFDAAHPIVTPVEGYRTTDDTETIYADLCLVPVLLIDRAIPLDALAHPLGLPAEFVVGEAVGCEGHGRYPASVLSGERVVAVCQRGISRRCEGSPIKAACAKSLRPGAVKQRILADFPAQVRTALETGIGFVQTLCIDIDEVGLIHARIGRGRRRYSVATDTAHRRADFRVVRAGIARAGR